MVAIEVCSLFVSSSHFLTILKIGHTPPTHEYLLIPGPPTMFRTSFTELESMKLCNRCIPSNESTPRHSGRRPLHQPHPSPAKVELETWRLVLPTYYYPLPDPSDPTSSYYHDSGLEILDHHEMPLRADERCYEQ